MKKDRKFISHNSELDSAMLRDKPRLDCIRSLSSKKLHWPPDLSGPKMPGNLADRHEIDKASDAHYKEKAAAKECRFAEIKQRIDDGFYDDPNNLAELAERIIKKFGLD